MEDFIRSPNNGQPSPDERANPKTRACSNCARLKMKCQWPASGAGQHESPCARCARIKLPCQVPQPTQRKKRGKSTRVAQLEKKIDGIVSLLAANQGIHVNSRPPMTPESPETLQSQFGLIDEPAEICTDGVEGAIPTDVSKDLTHFELFPGFRITHAEAERYLALYREEYVPRYPFIPISPLTACLDLYSQSRFLFWTIMAVVVPLSSHVQPLFKTWFRKYLAEHMIVRQEKRLEMLQAILVYLGWNDFHFYIEMQAANLLQLAMALVIDLKLDLPPGSIGVTTKSLISDAWSKLGKSSQLQKTAHTSDEKRAVLGFHHISCLIAALFRRGSQLHWNNHLAHCCDDLAQQQEYDTDSYLTALVRMQNIATRAYALLPGATAEFHESAPAIFRGPLDMAMNSARREMEEFVQSQPEVVRKNKFFLAHYHVFSLRLYEPVIAMRSPTLGEAGTLASEPFQRSEALWKCLQFASEFFDHQLLVPVVEIPTLPFTASGLLAFSIVSLSRLLLLESTTDWDPALARKRIDFANLMKRLSERFEDVERRGKELGRRTRVLDDGSSVYMKYGFKMRWIRHWYLVRVPQEQQPLADAQDVTASVADMGMDQWNDFQIDQNFWQELMTVYESDFLEMPTGMDLSQPSV